MARTLSAIVASFALALGAGALLAPAAWHLVHSPDGLLPQITFLARHDDFHRYVNRCQLILALGLIWPLLRWQGMTQALSVGLGRGGGEAWQWLGAAASGMCMVAVVALAAATTPESPWSFQFEVDWARHARSTLIAALLVPVLEDLLFRGTLFGILRRSMNWRHAAMLASVMFAAAHFLDPRSPNPSPITWHAGLDVMADIPMQLSKPGFAPKFLTLCFAGYILCSLYQRTGSLYASMGMHAAWIVGGKTLKAVLTRSSTTGSPTPPSLLWGQGDFLESWVVTAVFFSVALLHHFKKGRDEQDHHSRPA